MTDPTRRLKAVALAATFVFAACGASATPASTPTPATGAPASAGKPAPTPAPASSTPTTAPSLAPGTDLSPLAGNWVASIEDVQLNYATGDFAGGTITVDGGQIRLTANGGDTSIGAAGLVGPTAITDCKPTSCKVANSPVPWLMSVLGDGTVAMLDIAFLTQIDAGAGVCDAPVVSDAGVVTLTGNTRISFVTGAAGGFGVGSGTDPCAGAKYQIIWTQVLTKAP
ncbi:MAG: hypothetical protein ABIZ34_07535 [Candidatus Limnocylindrales bacterium]